MRPGIREQCLETVRQAMAELGLQGLIAGVRVIPHQIKLAGEVRIRRVVNILPHQLSARRAEVGDREDIGLSQSSFPPPRSTHTFWAIRDSGLPPQGTKQEESS
jgi:hypothetical protein